MELSKEMMKAGIIEEMLDDTMETFTEEESLEEAAQEEIDKIILELTTGKLTDAPAAVKDTLPVQESREEEEEVEEESEELEEMQSRLEALRS